MTRFLVYALPLLVVGAFGVGRMQRARELSVLRTELAGMSARLEASRAECRKPGVRWGGVIEGVTESTLRREATAAPRFAEEPRPTLVDDPATLLADTSAEPPSEEEALFLLEQAFLAEPTERSFQHQAEAELGEKLSRLAAPRGRVRVECRSALCRASVVLPDEAAYQAFSAQSAAASGLWDGESTFQLQSKVDGRVELALYFAKSGTSLPVAGE
ncbi:MAG TPA: hypothetical protein VIM73_16750 [Polyangiaceae bacterium]